jgi:hypothetical protein
MLKKNKKPRTKILDFSYLEVAFRNHFFWKKDG